MKKQKFAVLLMVILALVLGVAIVYAAEVMVDNFEGAVQTLSIGSGTTSSVMLDSNAIGGERDFELIWLSGAGVSIASNAGTPASGALAFSSESATSGRAIVTYDGPDNNATVLDVEGLCPFAPSGPTNCLDLTDGGSNTHLRVRIVENDLATTLHFRLYNGPSNDAGNYNEYDINLPGGIAPGDAVDFLMPFASPSQVGGSGANPNAVGAIQVFFNPAPDPATVAVDVSIDFFDATAEAYDFGDLPNTYGTVLASNGPRHLLSTGLRLGGIRDSEADGVPTANATGDNVTSLDDEEGVTRDTSFNWDDTNGGAVYVTVQGCAGTGLINGCRLNGWFDWNEDGIFQTTERAINNIVIGNAEDQYVVFPIPTGAGFPSGSTRPLNARFRVCQAIANLSTACSSPTGEAQTGEVEDYQWGFGPTAVSLQSFSAANSSSLPVYGLMGFAALAMAGVVALVLRRERKQA